uniref:Uncharacterized protein n=1 Tax=Glossina palpalis gambiensis TaxID=67801 RepID=A0A1B0B5V6_9MUSC
MLMSLYSPITPASERGVLTNQRCKLCVPAIVLSFLPVLFTELLLSGVEMQALGTSLRLLVTIFFAFCFTSISVGIVAIAAAAIDVRVVFLIVFVEDLVFLDSSSIARLLFFAAITAAINSSSFKPSITAPRSRSIIIELLIRSRAARRFASHSRFCASISSSAALNCSAVHAAPVSSTKRMA